MQHIVYQENRVIISKQHPFEVVWADGHVGKEGGDGCSEVASLVPFGI